MKRSKYLLMLMLTVTGIVGCDNSNSGGEVNNKKVKMDAMSHG